MKPRVRFSVLPLFLILASIPAASQVGEAPPVFPPRAEVEVEPPSEEHLLREVCRYLRVSRRQAGLLLPSARYIERSRELFAREEAEAERQLAKLQDRPDEAQRVTRDLEARRARVAEDLVAFSTPQLLRVLTREQVALAWRLIQGQPPAYTQAHNDLLRPEAGIAVRRQGGRLNLLDSSLRLEVDQLSEVLGARHQRAPTSGAGYQIQPSRGVVGTPPPVAAEKPFPQLVVESNDLRELIPHVEPLVRRVFLSEEWLPTLMEVWRKGLPVRPSRDHRLVTRKPTRVVRDYRMERGLRDLTGRGPELEPLGGTLDHGLYLFGPGQGLKLGDTGVRDSYTVEFSFRFHGGNSYQKLLDFKKGTQDGGLYTYQGHLTFYTLANGGAPQPGREHRIRLERDRETRVVRGYLDLQPIFAFIDLDDEAVFQDGMGMFFVDDLTTRDEQGAGAVRWVNVRAPETATKASP